MRATTGALPLGRADDPVYLAAIRDPGRRVQAQTALAALTATWLRTPPADPRARGLELRRLAGHAQALAYLLITEAASLPEHGGMD